MSTNNNASQTLFRFVSLRNPQLTETKTKNLGFIQRPKKVKGIFDEAVSNRNSKTLKQDALYLATRDFESGAFKTETELEEGDFSQLLTIGRKISKKQTLNEEELEYTRGYYKDRIDDNKELKQDAFKEFGILWDNLLYQVVTQKDFYVKEAVSHILKAIHIGFSQNIDINDDVIKANGGKKPLDNALTAQIVLPAELFVESGKSDTGGSAVSVTGKITEQRLIVEAENSLRINKALYRKESLEKLNSELKPLQESYFRARNKTYQQAYLAYQDENREQIRLYQSKLEEVEKQITDKTTEEEKARLYETLKEFELPVFEFFYPDEINFDDLKANLSPESFDLFLELFSDAPLKSTEGRIAPDNIQISDRIQSYHDAIGKIQGEISLETQAVLENATLTQQQYINLGGASVPVVPSASKTPLAYSLISYSPKSLLAGNRGFVSFAFEAEDVSWNVFSAKIIADTDLGHFEESHTDISVIDGKIPLPSILINRFRNISALRIEITFKNGREAYTDLSGITNEQVYTGILTLKEIKKTTEEQPSEETSKRNNFGIKRLGVADYLKVVQSVHAYVPGEVSNIENVMASELRHKSSVSRDYSEITETTSKSEETEKISDTSKTSRTDMQTEVAKELDKQQSFQAHTRASGKAWGWTLEAGADYANNTAQHDSTRQAVTKSQEITERAMERVLTKISEERVQKIIKEYTETNVHEFDNRGKPFTTNESPKHITGVYRWIDKKMKNQIYNYGIRSMLEFMIPEPARLHRLATAVAKGKVLTSPVDPRTADKPYTMSSPQSSTKELLQYWAGIYGVALTGLPQEKIQHVIGLQYIKLSGDWGTKTMMLDIPQNYAGKKVTVNYGYDKRGMTVDNFQGGMLDLPDVGRGSNDGNYTVGGLNITGSYPFLYHGRGADSFNVSFVFDCELSDDFMLQWKTENFNAIIKAYQDAYVQFQEDQAKLDAEQKEKESDAKETQSNFYRYMEADVLKHNCIAYLLQDYLNVLGQSFTDGDKMDNFQVYLSEDLDNYTALAKFMEQAFEWEIMDYTFYPYYWANRKRWQEMYISESVDPLFRSFLQAGMARVIVTVKPGFENAVNFFLTTGKIWNGGEVPVIDDPMYMSIVDEMRQPQGKAQGKYWITKVPTTLTILQDKSTGLPVSPLQPLPIFPEDEPENCENPKELEFATSFEQMDIQLSHSDKTESTLD